MNDPYRARRTRMVEEQIVRRGVLDPLVLDAMRKVPRHRFLPTHAWHLAYEDEPVPIGRGQTMSQPYVVALMSELCQIGPGDRVLEVGTGSGYQAAVLVEMGAEVYSVEIVEEVARQARENLTAAGYLDRVQLRVGDAWHGWPEAAPFQAILVTAAPEHVPEPLVQQLTRGGHLVIPVGDGDAQELVVIRRDGLGLSRESVAPVMFVPMTGKALTGRSSQDGPGAAP